MRLVMVEGPEGPAAGIETADGDVLLAHRILGRPTPATVVGLLKEGTSALTRLAEQLAAHTADPTSATASGSLLSNPKRLEPMGERVLLLAAGANYRAHLTEMGEDMPEKPAYFVKSPNAVVGPGSAICLPASNPDMVDWEGELCVVIGAPCHAVSAEDAWKYVAGYTILNDVSARDGIAAMVSASTALEGRWGWTDMLLGKQFPTFAPLGPAVVTADEFRDPSEHRLQTLVNGTVMQDTSISDLAVDIPHLIEQFSKWFSFAPGDIISTGTPSGVGHGRSPAMYLGDGDEVTVRVSGIGDLTNPVRGQSLAIAGEK